MPRILLFSGKGGVGKTTVAAATGVTLARLGIRTLVLSFDLAHSLADAFGLDQSLFDQRKGRPIDVCTNLTIQEIDVQEEVEQNWRDKGNAFSALLAASGVTEVAPEDLALMPGMEDLITLLHISKHADDTDHDVIVLDSPPTGDSLRFVSLPHTVDWYVRKRFGIDTAPKRRPGSPSSSTAENLIDLRARLARVEGLLRDSSVTSVRLVATPERLVFRETQRAYMYFSLYGLVTDMFIANRVFPAKGPAAQWRRSQEPILEQFREMFAPVPIIELPLHTEELVGLEELEKLGREIYQDRDPAAKGLSTPVYYLDETSDQPCLIVSMPFASQNEVDLHREADSLIVRVGSFKRHLPLPPELQRAKIVNARLTDGQLRIQFEGVPAGAVLR